MSTTREDILKVLSLIEDPYFNRDIVSLGLVKEAAVLGDRARVRLELTTPAYPPRQRFEADARRLVGALPGIAAVDVEISATVLAPHHVLGNGLPGVKHVVAVASGKGGVGKSTIAVNLALALAQSGAAVGLLDADIFGPSIPIMLGERREPRPAPSGKIEPLERHGIRMMSMGFLAKGDTPMILRGPMIAKYVQHLLLQVEWGDLDYLVIDLPPGTGDAQLTLAQSAPLSGAVIVTTPQDVALEDVFRAIRMFEQVRVPILGVVENMSGFVCPHCGESTPIFRSGGGMKASEREKVPLLGQVPLDPEICEDGDLGTPIVVANPESPQSEALRAIAGEVAARLSVLAWQG